MAGRRGQLAELVVLTGLEKVLAEEQIFQVEAWMIKQFSIPFVICPSFS